ncbi:GNAT family N-acetyltransferase [Saccharopolyspora sp. MS10]|uniref:GNAT family N-acetyltransferase n=1 Tax=Saccharopolyspora sp. MS10 TaxID=3385973 RepID=UPI0039A162B7
MTTIDAGAVESMYQLSSAWRALVLDSWPDADARDMPGIAVRWADSRFPFWNCVTLTDTGVGPELLARQLEHVAEIMREKSRPGLAWIFEDLLDPAARSGLPALAAEAGLETAYSGVGMAGDLLPLPAPEHPELTFERATEPEQFAAFADVNSRAYGFPLEDGRDGLRGTAMWRTEVHAYLGLRDGEPVAAAAAMPCEGRLFVLLVATSPEAGRRGYGEAVTRKALHEGGRATGLTRATLHATAAGAPVYGRIGFRPTARMRYFALES